jgi:uncharacterized protein Yka (UPF0111/DUF47 family)
LPQGSARETETVLNLFRAFMPKDGRFFELFQQHSLYIVSGAEALRAMLDGGEAVQQHHRDVLAHEDAADSITREVAQAVRRTFVTPFDRGDIQALISRMDDTIDEMKSTAKAISTYEMRHFEPNMRFMGDAIVRCAGLVKDAIPLLSNIGKNSSQISEYCEQIRRMEGEADEIHDEGVTVLFRAACEERPQNALRYLARREVFDRLERTVDHFDDLANEIESIVVEHV